MSSRLIIFLFSIAALGGGYYYLTADNDYDREERSARVDNNSDESDGDEGAGSGGLFAGLPGGDVAPENEAQSKVTRAWFSGVWVMEGEYCASGSPLSFDENGEYREVHDNGRWTLNGSILTITAQPFDENGPTGEEKTYASSVEFIDENEAVFFDARWRRCLVEGGPAEPWHSDD